MNQSIDVEPFRLLFVCTGNTCRSPMAEVIARARLEALGWTQVEVASAGIGAWDGSPASGGALRAAAARGLELGGHESTFLTPELVEWADLVLTMSVTHLAHVHELGGAEKASLITTFAAGDDPDLAGAGIPDPVGGPDEEYVATFEVLDGLVERALERLAPLVSP